MNKETTAIHTPYQKRDAFGALSMPVYHSVAYEFDDAKRMSKVFCGEIPEPDYSRVGNPTVTYLEDKIKELTGAHQVVALNSGMAAISAILFAIASAGKNIVSSRHLFGNTYSLLTSTLKRFGVTARLVDLTEPKAVVEAVDSDTCAIFLEIITNPQMEVADIRTLAKIAHDKGAMLIADTTMVPFTEFDGKALGMDFQVVSTTKYVSGGATSLGGVVIDYGNNDEFSTRLRKEVLFNFGAYMTPHPAYMQTLGLETMDVRYRRQTATTAELARRLENLLGKGKVNHPTSIEGKFHELANELYGSNGPAMLTFELSDQDECFRFINALRVIKRATNLFDNRTLAIHPSSTIFGPFPPEERKQMDVLETTIRLSVGLEDVDDLWNDLHQAITTAKTEK